MLSMVIVMLGCVAMAAGDCPTAISTLTKASYEIFETTKMLPGNMMAGNCMLNVMYSTSTNTVQAQINGMMFMNMMIPMPMTNSTMFFIIDPMKCTSTMWGNITSVEMAMEYLASIRTGALIVTMGAPLSMDAMMELKQYTTMMPMMMKPMNMPTTMPAGSMNIYDVIILQTGFPEKTMMMDIMSGMSSMYQYLISGNTMNLMITPQMPKSMMMPTK